MNIRLWGYFDKNFGDDLMQLIVIRSMKEYRFFADCAQREFLTHLYGEENVTVGGAECKADAVANVIGTGFRYRSKMNILTKFLSLPSEDRTKYAKKAVIDCSVDAPKNAAERWLVRRELNKYGLISCRDEVSRELISEMTAKGEVCRHEDIVFALGDEYISKPFSPRILVARVESLLKRNHLLKGKTVTAGGIEVNREARTVTANGKEVDLTFKEFELLNYFIDNPSIALSRDKILNNVWDFDYFGDVRTVDTHVKKLRSKLLDCGAYIKTVRGLGYKFETEETDEEQD